MKEPTDAIKVYMENPTNCPFCGSNELENDSLGVDSGEGLSAEAWCNECGASWKEYYTINKIMVHTEGDQGV